MGVDVNLYAKGTADPEQVAAASDLLLKRLPDWLWTDEEGPSPVVTPANWQDDEVRWEVSTPSRYYGPGYERGDWPRIYAAIRCLQAALPGCTIHYGGDSDDQCPEATDEYLDEIWRHWLGADGDAYRTR